MDVGLKPIVMSKYGGMDESVVIQDRPERL
jgi:hypothetical protein